MPDNSDGRPPSQFGTTVTGSPLPDEQLLFKEPSGIQLEVMGGPMDGHRQRATNASFTVGRGPTNDLALNLDSRVSLQHARIVQEGRHYWLEDLDSSNGTYIGDQRITKRALIGPGTSFTVGDTMLEFLPA